MMGICGMDEGVLDDHGSFGETCFDVAEAPFDGCLTPWQFVLGCGSKDLAGPLQFPEVNAATRDVSTLQCVDSARPQAVERVDDEWQHFQVDLEGRDSIGDGLQGAAE